MMVTALKCKTRPKYKMVKAEISTLKKNDDRKCDFLSKKWPNSHVRAPQCMIRYTEISPCISYTVHCASLLKNNGI